MSCCFAYRRSVAFLALNACLSTAAAVELNDHLSLSGFGTAAALRTDTDEARYVRESQSTGATDSVTFGTDSNIGLQLNAKANDWLSATLQVVSKRRSKVYDPTQVEWAFVKIEPVQNLSLRGGRMAMPTFAISDSRNIGYSNPWIRAPNEVYGVALVDQFTGVDVSYRRELGEGSLKLSALAGRTDFALDLDATRVGLAAKIDMKRVRGANLSWENDWLTLRVGRIEGHPYLPPIIGGLEVKYTFQGVGAIVNRNNLLLQGEYVTRRATVVSRESNTDGWYLLGGYRIGQFQPFVGYSKLKAMRDASFVNGSQSSTTLGLRWDFHRSLALKAQWDRVDTHGTRGISFNRIEPAFDGTANVYALALDFVF